MRPLVRIHCLSLRVDIRFLSLRAVHMSLYVYDRDDVLRRGARSLQTTPDRRFDLLVAVGRRLAFVVSFESRNRASVKDPRVCGAAE